VKGIIKMAFINFMKEFIDFIKERKLLWIAPILIILLLLGLFIVFSSSSAVAPFIYTVF